MRRKVQPIYKFPFFGEWQVFTENTLKELEQQDKDKYEYYDNFIYEHQLNPLRNFLPHGDKSSTQKQHDGILAMNDWRHDLVLILGPNQTGKSVFGMAFTSLHGLIPTDPNWPVYTHHRVKYREWTGPKIAIVASWSWDNTEVVWDVYRRFLPRSELGRYAMDYGAFEGEKGRALDVSFRNNTTKTVSLACGSKIIFLCYTQQQIHWEGKQCDLAHLDEQCPEDKFDGLAARQLTRGDYTPMIMTLTGHILPGRPDTGAAGWIKAKVIDQGLTKGRKFREYHLSIDSTPDAIMSKQQKEAAYQRLVVEPERTHNVQKINEGIARYWGGWQVGGGLTLSEFNPDIHVIEPFDYKRYNPTYYRMIDHGQNPCAMLLFAKMPWGDTLIIGEYYEYGFSISENCKKIVEEKCGNMRRFLTEDQEGGATYDIYEEVESGMSFAASEIDGRSFNTRSNESGFKIGLLYNNAGCRVSPARTVHDFNKDTAPLIKELFALEQGKQHINLRLGRKFEHPLLKYGAPKIYFLGVMPNLQAEISNWIDTETKSQRPQNKKDHLLDCLGFYAGRERPYMGPIAHDEDEDAEPKKHNSWRI